MDDLKIILKFHDIFSFYRKQAVLERTNRLLSKDVLYLVTIKEAESKAYHRNFFNALTILTKFHKNLSNNSNVINKKKLKKFERLPYLN